MRHHSNENEFDLHKNGREGGTHFHINGFARRLVLKQRQKVALKGGVLPKRPSKTTAWEAINSPAQKHFINKY